jgi:hypothetical protein
MNRGDPLLQRAFSALSLEDQRTITTQLDELQWRLAELASMSPDQPFPDAQIRVAGILAYAIQEKLRALEWYDEVRRELAAHDERLRPRR